MDYDLAIIGAGWAGFNAAIEAKKSGLKTVLIENDKIGGTCLNRGCIPTKTLIRSAKIYSLAKKSNNFGIEINEPKINYPEIIDRKNKIVLELGRGMEFMLKGVDFLPGQARILTPNTIKVGGQELAVKFMIIASGSEPCQIKGLDFDHNKVVSSDDILNLREIPKKLLIVGGGVIGCEFASLFSTLGAQVSIIEKMPQLLPGIDNEIAKKLENILRRKGIKVNTGTDALGVDLNQFDLVLVAVGRVARINGLGLEDCGITIENKKIKVDDFLKTNIANIYAAGDCTGKICLAHFASYQGVTASYNIAHPVSQKKCDNAVVPNCIFTDPEVSSVGINEEEAKAREIETVAHKFDFLGLGMARILDEAQGYIKIISDTKTGFVLGGSIIGPSATELIAPLTLAISNSLKASQIRETIFAHPTLSECIHETLK